MTFAWAPLTQAEITYGDRFGVRRQRVDPRSADRIAGRLLVVDVGRTIHSTRFTYAALTGIAGQDGDTSGLWSAVTTGWLQHAIVDMGQRIPDFNNLL